MFRRQQAEDVGPGDFIEVITYISKAGSIKQQLHIATEAGLHGYSQFDALLMISSADGVQGAPTY